MRDGLAIFFSLVIVGVLTTIYTICFQSFLWDCFGWDWPLWIDIAVGFLLAVFTLYVGVDLIVIVWDD